MRLSDDSELYARCFLLYRKLRFLERGRNACFEMACSSDSVERQQDKTIRYILEDIKSFFTKIVTKFIIIEEIMHIQKGFIAHGADVL